jgi:hypothetical protein
MGKYLSLKKIIDRLWSKIYSLLFIVIGVVMIGLVTSTLFNDIKYFTSPYLLGKIINIHTDYMEDPQFGDDAYYVYTINVGGKRYLAPTSEKFSLEINDKVACFRTSISTVKIIFVNGKKIQNKYGAEDYFSLIVLLSVILVPLVIIKIKRKKK